MCDPWYMIILLEELGRDYLVWDKAATINFKKPGKGLVRALFEIDSSRVEEIRKAVDGGEKHEPVFEVQILDERDQVVAIVEKNYGSKRRSLLRHRLEVQFPGCIFPPDRSMFSSLPFYPEDGR